MSFLLYYRVISLFFVYSVSSLLPNALITPYHIVETIIEEDCKANNNNKGALKTKLPLNITIVTHDVALFCDARDASHQRGLGRFWDQIKPFFQDGTVGKLHVVIAKTGVIATAKQVGSEDDAILTDAADAAIDTEATKDTEKATDAEARDSHEVSIDNCVRTMRSQCVSKAETDARFNGHKPIPPVEIAISMMDAKAPVRRLGFKSLSRRCLRDIVDSTSAFVFQSKAAAAITGTVATVTPKHNGIVLQLPETIDGTQSSITLDVRYRMVPFALDRPVTSNGFFWDLQAISGSALELVQQVPLACVDANLIYGVPMEVRAGFLDDIQQYQEALVLVRSVFRRLQQKQVGLLLRTTDPDEDEDEGEVSNKGIFHNNRRGQMFLLTANETVGVAHSSSGTLFRLASADEFLLEAENPRSQLDTSAVPEDLKEQCETYVENALDLLDCKPVNPLYLDAVANPVSASSPHETLSTSSYTPMSKDRDSRWNDDTGVGALVATGEADDILSLDSDNNCVAFEYD